MNTSFNPARMQIIRNLLIVILIAKAVSLVMLWYFPGEGVNYNASSSKMPEYKRYSLRNIIQPTQLPDARSATGPTGEELTAYGPNISNMVLTGLYKSKDSGFVIIALKAKPNDSQVLGIDDVFQGYQLRKILDNGAVFSKGGQNYSLYFSEEEERGRSVAKGASTTGAEGVQQVAKSDISYYAKNVEEIWKDISIIEVKQGNQITGFKVTRIKPNSPFAKLGLRQGDIIIKANNKPMTSYKDAIAIYNGIDKLQALELVVLRNNQETEIVYEIY